MSKLIAQLKRWVRNQNSHTEQIALIAEALRNSRPKADEWDNECDEDLYESGVVERHSDVALSAWWKACYAVTKSLPEQDQKAFAEFVGFGREAE